MSVKTCPDCLSEIPAAAAFCRHCGQRVEGPPCPDCGARNSAEAAVCRWCGHRFERDRRQAQFRPFDVTVGRLSTFLRRGRFLPQTIRLTTDKIVIVTPGVFNLSRQEEEIPWAKVAGFDYKSGIFWDEVKIETRGQSASRMQCLPKPEGARIRQVLQELEL